MGGAPQGAMRVASQIWQVVFTSQTLQVFCLAFRKKAQYVVVLDVHVIETCEMWARTKKKTRWVLVMATRSSNGWDLDL